MNIMEKNSESLLYSFWKFIKRPRYEVEARKAAFWPKFFDIMKFWSLGIVVAALASYFSSLYTKEFGMDDSQNILQDFFSKNSPLVIVLIVFIWGPLSEELTFRLFLRYSPKKFSVFLSFLSLLALEMGVSSWRRAENYLNWFFEKHGVESFMIAYLLLLLLFYFLFLAILKKLKADEKIEKSYLRYFPFIFYASTLLFAFVHFYNYENFNDLWLALPFLVAPQLLLGLILSYIRLSYGFYWALFFHSFHNAIISLPPLLFSQVSEKSIELIQKSKEGEILAIPYHEKIYYMLGIVFSLMIFLLVVISFYYLLKNHFRFLKNKNGHSHKN